MDMDSVLGVLGIVVRLMSETVRSRSAERVRRIAAWVWGLLGKCREVGQLATEEVGAIRELGKRVVTILAKIREAEGTRDSEDDDDVGMSDSDEIGEGGSGGLKEGDEAQDAIMEVAETAEDESTELEAAKARLQAQLDGHLDSEWSAGDSGGSEAQDATKQARIMFDMILTVVGEYFGQRDLLDSREIWAV
jgi:regulator of vacuolar morphogenesis